MQSERIVCATDFSKNATAALRWAAALVRRTGGLVDLVTAVRPIASTFPDPLMGDTAAADEDTYKQATERIATTAAGAAKELGVRIEGHAIHADTPSAIAEYAATNGARMIVLGAHGGPPLARWLLGSVADRTIRAATCPVVVVPPPAETGGARTGWERDPARPIRVLVGVDGRVGGDRARAFACGLAGQTLCDLTFVHLYWPINEYARLGLQGQHDLFQPDPAVVENLEPGLREHIGTVPGGGAVSLSVRPAWGQPAANLLVAAEEGDVDLLVVGSEQRHGLARFWHPSTVRQLVKQALAVPVVCLPASAASPDAQPGPLEIPRLSTILAPTDLSAAGNAAVPYAYTLLADRGGVVELCHIYVRSLPNPPFAYERPREPLDLRLAAEIEAQLRALVPPQAAARGIATHVSVIDGAHPGEAIVQAAERFRVDAISLGSHGRGALARVVLGSVAEHVVHHSRKPVLVSRTARTNQ